MNDVLRIAHLRIAHQVANPEVGKREGNLLTWPDLLQGIRYLPSIKENGEETYVSKELLKRLEV